MNNTMFSRLTAISRMIVLGVLCATPFLAHAQAFPNKPVRMVVPTGAGGSNDLVGRAVAKSMSEIWGQTVVVDNRAGAAGTIGMDIVAKAAPDGYTIALCASTFATNAAVSSTLPFDPLRDLVPVSMVASSSWVVVVNPGVPAQSMAELIQLAKARPGQINYSSTGEGGAIHLAGELLGNMAGVKFKHIPYKSTAQATNDVISGEIQMTITSLAAAMAQVSAGRLRVLASTGPTRLKQLPNVPTVGEVVPGYDFQNWFGVLAPRGTPDVIVNQIRDVIARSLTNKEITDLFAKQNIDAIGSTPAQFSAQLRSEITKFTQLAQSLGVRN